MTLRAGAAFVDILPRVGKSFSSDIDKAVSDPAEGVGKKAGGLLGGALGKAAAAAGGLFAAKEAFDFLGNAVDAARESNKVSAQTEAVIKSTGGAANLTAKQFGDLATAISNKTGVDDEAVQSAENLLATFTNVRNGVGKNNDIFSQATSIMVDMGAAMGTEPKAAAIQLGKALNDPIKGVTALSRVGVTFTDEQKKTIATMVETGKTAEAQKVILAELRKEFGGSAAAQANAGDRLKVTLGNLQEDLGNRLLPIVDKVASFLADKLPGAIDKAGRFFGAIGDKVRTVVDAFRWGFAAWDTMGTRFQSDNPFAMIGKIVHEAIALIDAFKHAAEDGVTDDGIFGAVQRAGILFTNTLLPALRSVADFIGDHLKPILIGIGVIMSPGGALIVGLIAAYQHFEGFRNVVNTVVSFVIDTIGSFVDWWKQIWPQVSEAVGHVMAAIQAIVGAVLSFLSDAWSVWGDDIGRIVGGVFGIVKSIIETAVNTIAGVIRLVLAVINGDWGKAWEALKDIVRGIWDGIFGIVKGAIGVLVGLIGGIGDTIRRVASGMFDAVKEAFVGALNWIIRKWNGLEFKVPSVDVPGLGKIGGVTIGVPDVPYLHTGGIVPGPPGADVLAVLQAGELVTSRRDLVQLGSSSSAGVDGRAFRDLIINPSPGMSEAEVGRVAAREVAWASKTA